LHWYQALFDAACTHVRAGTLIPSVAELQYANVLVQLAVDVVATKPAAVHLYMPPLVAD
jgi:hypothetical protein